MPDFREGNCMSFRIAGAALCGGLLVLIATATVAAENKKQNSGQAIFDRWGNTRSDKKPPKEPGGVQPGALTVRKAGRDTTISPGGRRDGGPAAPTGIYLPRGDGAKNVGTAK
jgi:hypothetical protein